MLETEDFLKSANIFIAAKDKNLKYLYCNEQLADILGLDSPHQIVGKTDYNLHTEEVAKIFQSGDKRILNGGTFVNEYEDLPIKNRSLNICTTKNKLRNKSDEVTGVVLSFIDLTNTTSNISGKNYVRYDHKNKQYHIQLGNLIEVFTEREYFVLKKLLNGLTAKETAKQLLLSPRTVEDYITKIKCKFQCSSKHHIIEAAIRLGVMQSIIG